MAEDKVKILTSVFALATLFSNCVEAFGLIHPQQSWERQEQLLLTKLGIQQARLLVWGGILGVTSPPSSVATHMIPTHPALTNPNPEEPVYFGDRDVRLDYEDALKRIKEALTDIIDRSEHLSREQMMSQYGLKPSKKGITTNQSAVDNNRLEGFREKYSLLLDLIEAYGISPPRGHSMVAHSWTIADTTLFAKFVELIRRRVDILVHMMALEDKVNRAVSIDIKALGWHPSLDRASSARNISKLMVINEACRTDYPDFAWATQQAMDNMNDRWKGSHAYELRPEVIQPIMVEPVASPLKAKRPGILSKFRPNSWRKESKKEVSQAQGRARSGSVDTPRSLSGSAQNETPAFLERARSKSVSDVPVFSIGNRMSVENPLTKVGTITDDSAKDLAQTSTLASMISRHDQWLDHY